MGKEEKIMRILKNANLMIVGMVILMVWLLSFSLAVADEVVLFDARIHDLSAINNYTASWRKGSNITPVAKKVTRDGKEYVEFSFKGDRGMACSTIYFGKIPNPDEGMNYTGIRLIIDYDRSDYGKVKVNASFSDNTQLTRVLTLDRGTHEYFVRSGFRRADFPPKWELLRY